MVQMPQFWREMPKKKRKELISNIIIVVVVIGLTFGTVPFLRLILQTKYPLVVVSSGSMEPTIYKGDILIIGHKDPGEIMAGSHENRTGDVILYDAVGLWPGDSAPPEPIVHRVVDSYYDDTEDTWYYIAYGDNNSDTDPPGSTLEIPIPEDRVLGVVKLRIPKIGWIKIWMNQLKWLSTVLIVGLGVLLIISIVSDTDENEEDQKSEKDKKSIGNTSTPANESDLIENQTSDSNLIEDR